MTLLGKFGKTWPGLNAPVEITQKKTKKKYKENYLLKPQMSEVAMMKPRSGPKATSDFAIFREKNADVPAWKKAFLAGEKKFGQNLSKRGWSGRTWRGREFGPPETTQRGRTLQI